MTKAVETATLRALDRIRSVISTNFAAAILARPDATNPIADLDNDGNVEHLPLPSFYYAAENEVPYAVNDDVCTFLFHRNDRDAGQRTTGSATVRRNVNSTITVVAYTRVLVVSDEVSLMLESGKSLTGRELGWYRAELYQAGIDWVAHRYGGDGDNICDIRTIRRETIYASTPQEHYAGIVEWEIKQDIDMPTNLFDG